MPEILNVNGQRVEVTNWNEFAGELLNAIGIQVEKAIIQKIDNFRLVDTGRFKQSIRFDVSGSELTLTNTAPYAGALEFGTFDYRKQFGADNFPATPDPKKKNLSRKAAKAFPKGGQPFAVYRRTLYNQNKMAGIVDTAAKLASK